MLIFGANDDRNGKRAKSQVDSVLGKRRLSEATRSDLRSFQAADASSSLDHLDQGPDSRMHVNFLITADSTPVTANSPENSNDAPVGDMGVESPVTNGAPVVGMVGAINTMVDLIRELSAKPFVEICADITSLKNKLEGLGVRDARFEEIDTVEDQEKKKLKSLKLLLIYAGKNVKKSIDKKDPSTTIKRKVTARFASLNQTLRSDSLTVDDLIKQVIRHNFASGPFSPTKCQLVARKRNKMIVPLADIHKFLQSNTISNTEKYFQMSRHTLEGILRQNLDMDIPQFRALNPDDSRLGRLVEKGDVQRKLSQETITNIRQAPIYKTNKEVADELNISREVVRKYPL